MSLTAPTPPALIGEAPAFLDTLAHVSAAAPLDRPLLVIGERGAGKELIAARIHFLSQRWDQPFVKVNCAALSDELLESELFGHEAGAFTGAQKRHVGRFERADGGTLFLDEIASASLRVQEKLLRVIEYGEYERLGGETTLTCHVRVVGATNVDLPARAARGAFRADLLDRLAFDVIAVPPLRARKEDIPLLAAHFGAGMAAEIGVDFPGFAQETMEAFIAHGWPGNIRELKNTAERSVYRWISAGEDGPIGEAALDPFEGEHRPPADLAEASKEAAATPSRNLTPTGAYDFSKFMLETERRLLSEALLASGGNQRRAADRLKLTYDQLRGLIKKHGLKPKRS